MTLETASVTHDWLITDIVCPPHTRTYAFLHIKSDDQVILVPATADFGADDYASWSKELARRLVTVAKKN